MTTCQEIEFLVHRK